MEKKIEPKPFTVTALTAQLKSLLETRFPRIYVEAEISDWRLRPNGHAYFALKDAGASISCVMFANAYAACCRKHPGIDRQLKDGAKVLVYGTVSVYAPKGNYQLVVLAAKMVGEGDLMQQYLALKAKLEAEGLFAAERKRRLPFLPRRIGIVTSETGAVIHDMCTVLARRFPALEIRLFPCLVQGAEAPKTIIAGIRYFNSRVGEYPPPRDRVDAASLPRDWIPDLLIVARGGGSFEDLYCFNDEELVRAVAASAVPTISAVGHETDYTLCDFAADVRAGTPSIAAEIAVPLLSDLRSQLATLDAKLSTSLRSRGEFFVQRIDQLSDALASSLTLAHAKAERRLDVARHRMGPAVNASLQRAAVRLEGAKPRLESALRMCLQRTAHRLETASAKLKAYSPYDVLNRGYSLTTAADGSVVRDAAALKSGDVLRTRFAKGAVTSVVAGVETADA